MSSEIGVLRAALEPFASYADATDAASKPGAPAILDRGAGALLSFNQGAAMVWPRDFRRAQAALRGDGITADLPEPTLADVAERIAAWQAATFGPTEVNAAALKLIDEAHEVGDAAHGLYIAEAFEESTDAAWADVAEEVADVFFLCVDLSRAFGGPEALARAALAKLARNEKRVWTQTDDGRWSGSKGDE